MNEFDTPGSESCVVEDSSGGRYMNVVGTSRAVLLPQRPQQEKPADAREISGGSQCDLHAAEGARLIQSKAATDDQLLAAARAQLRSVKQGKIVDDFLTRTNARIRVYDQHSFPNAPSQIAFSWKGRVYINREILRDTKYAAIVLSHEGIHAMDYATEMFKYNKPRTVELARQYGLDPVDTGKWADLAAKYRDHESEVQEAHASVKAAYYGNQAHFIESTPARRPDGRIRTGEQTILEFIHPTS